MKIFADPKSSHVLIEDVLLVLVWLLVALLVGRSCVWPVHSRSRVRVATDTPLALSDWVRWTARWDDPMSETISQKTFGGKS